MQKKNENEDFLFDIEPANAPFSFAKGGQPDSRTFEKIDLAFWLREEKDVILALLDAQNNSVWSMPFKGKKGYNQFRWDMIVTQEKSNMPYFINYKRFLGPNTYTVSLSDGKIELKKPFVLNRP
jgi:hypothetical protein